MARRLLDMSSLNRRQLSQMLGAAASIAGSVRLGHGCDVWWRHRSAGVAHIPVEAAIKELVRREMVLPAAVAAGG